MSIIGRVCALFPAILVNLWCGSTQDVSLCRILPDSTARGRYCSFPIARATFADVVDAFQLPSEISTGQQSVVAMQSASVQLSFGADFSSSRNATEPITARARVRSVLMRRYFASPKEASEFLAMTRRQIETTFACASEAGEPDWPGVVCRDPQNSGFEVKYLFTNWATEPNSAAPFEVTISVRIS